MGLTLPVTVLTLGLFIFVLNGLTEPLALCMSRAYERALYRRLLA